MRSGGFELTDPVSLFIPSFADVRVYAAWARTSVQVTVPVTGAGAGLASAHPYGRNFLTYGFHRVHPVDAMYRAAGFLNSPRPPARTWARACDIWAGIPLLFQPGTEWNYPVATDVLGRVIEVVSGQRLDEFLAARILGPLGMTDTGFYAGRHAAAPAGRPVHAGERRHRGQAGRPGRRRPPPAGHARRRRRPGLDRRGLSPIHPDAAEPHRQPGRRTRRHAAAEPAHGPIYDPQPPSWRP